MPEYLHPGVYVEEVSSGVRPIEGVSTSTAGFVGITAKGVPNKAVFLTSWSQFVRKFGDLISNSFLPYAVQQFFNNGGKRCYVVRTLNSVSAVTASRNIDSRSTTVRPTLRIDANGAGAWGDNISVRVEDATANPINWFKLIVELDGRPVELFEDLSMDPSSDNYVETTINSASEYIQVSDLGADVARNNGNRIYAQSTTTSALAAAQAYAAADALTLGIQNGRSVTVPIGTLAAAAGGTLTPEQTRDALNEAWRDLNATASLTTAVDAPAGRLRITHNVSGYERYFSLTGVGALFGVAEPLNGLDGFKRGAGTAGGAILKSAFADNFDTDPANVLALTVNGDTITVNLPLSNATALSDVRTALQTAFDLPANRGFLKVSIEDRGTPAPRQRLVISTSNKGSANSSLQFHASSTAHTAAVLDLRQDNGTAPVAAINGLGASEPAYIQSDIGPFVVKSGANFSLVVNNGVLGANSVPVVVTFSQGATFPNLQAVTAQQIATYITANAAAGTVTAAVNNNRVIISQARRGSYYTLKFIDGLYEPNLQLKFDAITQTGYEDGDKTSPFLRPAFNGDPNEPWSLTNGDDGSPVTNFDYIGTAAEKTGLHALDDVSDVNFVAIPGNSSPDVIGKAAGYCANRLDCFFIADAPGKTTNETPVTEPVHAQDFMRNKIPLKNSYAALYYPWLEISDPIGAGKNPKRFVPPSGFVAGLYARIDNTRGVWKAAAGTEATIIGALGLEYGVTDAEQDILNPVGVNCIRFFPATGNIIWGARTLATQSNAEWRYIPIRRYAIYLEQSIYRGTQWAVFEPNDAPLWTSLKSNIEDFMMGEFRKGALAGATPSAAYFVKCDEDLNPESEVAAGRVNMEIAFAPLRPAEFVIIRISQKSKRGEG